MKKDFGAALLLAVVTFVLYHDVLKLWWMNDDAYHLGVIAVTPFAHYFTSAAFWHAFVAPVFTPLLLASLAIDVALFGRTPHAFYLHQLLALTLVAPALYALLRQWRSRSVAFLATLTAMAGAPVMQIAGLLMLRHYVEGLLLAILATIVQVVAVRRDSGPLSIASAALALGAMLAKEVFVPLPVLLLFVGGTPHPALSPLRRGEGGDGAGGPSPRLRGEGGAKRRVRGAPHVAALAIYALWRVALLGPALRGYGWTVRPSQWPRVIATLPYRVLEVIAAHRAIGLLLVVPLLLCVVMVLVYVKRARLPFIVGVVAALVPVIPVAIELEPRYALGAWLLLVVTAAFVPRFSVPLLALTALGALVTNRVAWPGELRQLERMGREARAFAVLGPGDVLRNPAIPPASLGELQKLTHSPAVASFDDVFLCEQRIVARRLFAYDGDVKPSAPPDCTRLRAMPLRGTFTTTGGDAFYWTLGPRADGRYRFLLGNQAFDVPREGGFRLPTLRQVVLRVVYEAPDGTRTVSREIALDLDRSSTVALDSSER